MRYKRPVAAENCLCLPFVLAVFVYVNMLLVLLVTVALLQSNAFSSSADLYRSFNEFSRREIVNVLQTGHSQPSREFQNMLTEFLIRNISSKVPEFQLALVVSALVATNLNPKNVRGADLVADLIHRVDGNPQANPYAVLSLCNARGVAHRHLQRLVRQTRLAGHSNYSTHMTMGIETDALTLKALACCASLQNAHKLKLDIWTDDMIDRANRIAIANGYYQNIHTTSLVVQALTAFNTVVDTGFKWPEDEALEFLRRASTATGLTKAYYVVMGLNARRVVFLKDVHPQTYDTEIVIRKVINVTLALNNGVPELEFALQLRVPEKWNLYEIIKKASNITSRFKFEVSRNKEGDVSIQEVDGVLNDPERGMNWYFCTRDNFSRMTKAFYGPATSYFPADGEIVVLFYGSPGDCP